MWSYQAQPSTRNKSPQIRATGDFSGGRLRVRVRGQRVTTPFIRNKGTTGNSKLFSVVSLLLISKMRMGDSRSLCESEEYIIAVTQYNMDNRKTLIFHTGISKYPTTPTKVCCHVF